MTNNKKLHVVKLTRFELVHLRDLFNVKLPPGLDTTVSQTLAEQQERSLVEAALWQKLAAACEQANVELDDEAPDFVVSAAAAPTLSVFQLTHDPQQGIEEEVAEALSPLVQTIFSTDAKEAKRGKEQKKRPKRKKTRNKPKNGESKSAREKRPA